MEETASRNKRALRVKQLSPVREAKKPAIESDSDKGTKLVFYMSNV